MTIPLPKLVSLDVGGTLGFVRGPTITTILAAASKLPPSDVRRILRSTLHVAPKVTDLLIDTVCKARKNRSFLFPERLPRASSPILSLGPISNQVFEPVCTGGHTL